MLSKCALGALVALAFAASQASATVITPGQSSIPVTSAAAPGGSVLVTTSTPFSSISGPVTGFSGVLTSTVLTGDPTNPYGGLTFEYTISSDATSVSDIGRLTINNYSGFTTDASYSASSPGTAIVPASMSRSSSPGATLGFSFTAPPIAAGQSSVVLVVRTDSTAFQNSTMQTIDGDVAIISTYSPAPEPATLSLAAIGAVGLLLRRRR